MKNINQLIAKLEKNLHYNFRTFLSIEGALPGLRKALEINDGNHAESNNPFIKKFLATMVFNFDHLNDIQVVQNQNDAIEFRLIFQLKDSVLFFNVTVDADHCEAYITYSEDANSGNSIHLEDLSEQDLILFEEYIDSFNVMLGLR
ncbi:hypothetical protein [Polynucleobacter sp. MWH-UH25E]|uniref:hypothetical protein n=1 Tax=Polynucleobacter sp. MWH-UH25E TaxID=1855616 RepID=UPI001BFE077B|nr:hypothetical protein [Polynucleobacter sp. MWH-UH25E]QWD62820.1 hypothetical protein ICV39_04210 [Polynucleobacter sp. MWH-UH25E]